MTEKKYRNEDWLRNQYRATSKTTEEIASNLSVCAETVQTWIRKYDISKLHLDPEWLREKHRVEDKGPTEIANDCIPYDVSPAAVFNNLDDFDITRRYKDPDWLRKKYIDENMTSAEIADICGVDSQTVLRHLRNNDITVVSIDNMWDVYEAPLEGVTGSDHPWWGRTGEDHPRYKGEDYSWRNSPEWRRTKQLIRDRDGNICQFCASEDELYVHHIAPVSEGGRKFDPYNLITLCGDCHRGIHSTYYNGEPNWNTDSEWVTEKSAAY